jgi:hypothetical protein
MRTLALVAAVLGAAVATPLAAQNVSAIAGTPYNTTSVNAAANGSSMTGMKVDVCLSTGCSSHTWGFLSNNLLAGGFYGIQTADMRIRVGGNLDTYIPLLGDWRFDLFNTAVLQSVTFSGFGGGTVFDRTAPSPGTPGSDVGRDGDLRNRCFGFLASGGCVNFDNASVQYRNEVSLNNTVYGDLYESVFIDFTNVALTKSNAAGGLDESYSEFYLSLDSDNAQLVKVPEPTSFALVLPGLVALGAAARRRNRA